MYYSYVEIEYVATSFSPARTDLALKLLKTHITTQHIVTKYSLPGFGRLLLKSRVAEIGRNPKCCAWPPFIRLVGLEYYLGQSAHCSRVF
jgi:hypothetical protein